MLVCACVGGVAVVGVAVCGGGGLLLVVVVVVCGLWLCCKQVQKAAAPSHPPPPQDLYRMFDAFQTSATPRRPKASARAPRGPAASRRPPSVLGGPARRRRAPRRLRASWRGGHPGGGGVGPRALAPLHAAKAAPGPLRPTPPPGQDAVRRVQQHTRRRGRAREHDAGLPGGGGGRPPLPGRAGLPRRMDAGAPPQAAAGFALSSASTGAGLLSSQTARPGQARPRGAGPPAPPPSPAPAPAPPP